MEVLDDEQQRSFLGGSPQVATDGGGDRRLPRHRVEIVGRRDNSGPSGEARDDPCKGGGIGRRTAPNGNIRKRRQVVGDGLDEGLEWSFGVLEAHPEQDAASGPVDLSGELGCQATLADSRLTGKYRDARRPGDATPPQLSQPAALGGTTDEPRRFDEQLEHGGKARLPIE